ncbi:MAG TPA: hypothetical protein PLQ03_03180 [Brevundimonas sp.]|uniref:hypothetical protein n=1 Tax=Brevundimonas sp. TaxID=1871086 RepID=UPI002636F15D|nr:hypothetical protein [Brevundimonas sp.]HRO32392.1 hypothetical protein [Brevundimonas sp.]
MEYFTRAWALGDVSDEEWDKVESAYRAYIDTLDQGSAVWRFATTIGLNDAFVDRVIEDVGDIRLMLLTGDLQRGYWHTKITYKNARLILGRGALAQAVQNRPTEIWHDEFSGLGSEMVHRFLLVQPNGTEDRGEVHILFTDLEFSEVPARGRELPPL